MWELAKVSVNDRKMYLLVLWFRVLSGDKIEKNEMGGACSAYGGEEKRIQGFSEET
jgi:hypothetical protein